ncbi:hypothetical protein GCM10010519_76880 [Streptomyces lactacystinicus]
MRTPKISGAAAPAAAMTAVSMALTLAVVVMWLGPVMPVLVALVVGLGIGGGWLAAHAYERRLARQGDHSTAVTLIGWGFGLVAVVVLVAHGATAKEGAAGWLAVSWLPIGAKLLWVIHGLWERTALTPRALREIHEIQQSARDDAAVSRAWLTAQAGTEETRLTAVTAAGARVAKVQAKTARKLSEAWTGLAEARDKDGAATALTSVSASVTPGVTAVTPRWDLPVWTPIEAVRPQSAGALAPAIQGEDLDAIVAQLRAETDPPRSYRSMAQRFREEGHKASESALRDAWRRVTGTAEQAA